MGLAIPRPSKVTKKEAMSIGNNLKRHDIITKELIDGGMLPEAASKEALKQMRGPSHDEDSESLSRAAQIPLD